MKKSSIMFLVAAALFIVSAIFADKIFIKIIDIAAAVVFIVNTILTERGNKNDD